jgi:hypothetical protein
MAEQYSNRSDLRNPAQKVAKRVAPGQTYGEGAAQMRAQQAVPMASAPTDTAPAPQPSAPMPGSLGPIDRPTERPDEPITAGINMGPGPGSEALEPALPSSFQPGSREMLADQVRYIYSKYPNPAVFQLMLELENQPLL